MPVSRRTRDGVRHLIAGHARHQRHVGLAADAAGRAVHQIDVARTQLARQGHRVVEAPQPALAVHRGDTEEQRPILWPGGPHRLGDLERKTHAVLARAAIAIGAAVRHRREELVDQIAMRAVDFADVVARVGGALRRIAARGEHGADVVVVHLDRHRKAAPRRQRAGRQTAPRRHAGPRVAFIERAPLLHRAVRTGVAAAMAELDRRHRAHLLDEVGDAAIRARLVIVPDAGAVIGLAPARLDRGLLAEHDAGAAHRVAAEMHELPVGRAHHRPRRTGTSATPRRGCAR